MTSSEYGIELKAVGALEEKGVMDAVVAGDYLYFVGANVLCVADITAPAHPRIVGRLPLPGCGRQLVVRDGVAYITARADGVFIVDVRRAEAPELLAHYDCTELATGVQVSGQVMVVAQRQYGIEMVDVSNPRQPAFLSMIRTGEAQSVDIRNGYAYVGDWEDSQLTVVDIRDPRAPQVVTRCDLDGFGDGVCVSGDLIYASTGHHSGHADAHLKDEGDPRFGTGHGIEIFALSNPAEPQFLARAKFPRFHQRGLDMWSAVANGRYVYCADTFNGLFVLDVQDPRHPIPVARYPQLVAGVAVVDDYIYLAGVDAGLRVVEAQGLAQRPSPEPDTPLTVPPVRKASPARPAASGEPRVYRPGGQVWGVGFMGDRAIVAAGMAGLRIVQLWPRIEEMGRVQTQGFALGVAVRGDLVYVAEGVAGLGIWRYTSSDSLELLGRYHEAGLPSIRHVTAYDAGRYVIAECKQHFLILDVSDPTAPVKAAEPWINILYGNQTCQGLVDGRYTCVSGHRMGIRWLDLSASGQEIDTGINLAEADAYYFTAGVASLGDRVLATYPGGYRLASALETGLQDKPTIVYGGEVLDKRREGQGKPRVYGNGLYVSRRIASQVDIVDISDPLRPRLLRQLRTAGSPGGAVVHGRSLLIPDSYNGLLVYDEFVKALELEVDERSFTTS
ncbi:MAG: hypothetical protein GXY76_12040 [Chloroflexi bacterium]|nr:hypothetical protein [Chloroflexota bacterium]